MIKVILRVLYGLLLVAGIAAVGWLYMTGKPSCISKDKLCMNYAGSGWTVAKTTAPYDLDLTRTKPYAAQFRLAYTATNISGSANALAGALKAQLAKDAPAFKMVGSNAVIVGKAIGVEIVFDYTPPSAPGAVRQAYVVVPINKHTYYFIGEATAPNFDKVQPEFDALLQSVEFN